MNQYEAMFVFDPTFGAAFENCETEIRRLMDRADAEIVFLRRWDERRLAYRIKGRKRGVYVLVYFKSHPDRIRPLERDAQLAENILRLLVLRADGVTSEMMEKTVPTRGASADDAGSSTPGEPASPKATSSSPVADKAVEVADAGLPKTDGDASAPSEAGATAAEPATSATATEESAGEQATETA